jgi:hypothetical protein
MSMDDIRAFPLPLPVEIVGERAHVLEEIILRDRLGGTGIDVIDDHTIAKRDAPRQRWIVSSCVHDYVTTELGQMCGEGGNVNVLPAGVRAAQHRQRTCML